MERIISGYCRSQDQARTVLAECDGDQWDWDCEFSGCPFSDACTIGQQLRELQTGGADT